MKKEVLLAGSCVLLVFLVFIEIILIVGHIFVVGCHFFLKIRIFNLN